jgi:hypothetical protein
MQPITHTSQTPEIEPPWERHYFVDELATLWGFSRTTIRRWFEAEVGVLRLGSSRIQRGRRHPYVSLRIPESVAMRVYRRHTEKV